MSLGVATDPPFGIILAMTVATSLVLAAATSLLSAAALGSAPPATAADSSASSNGPGGAAAGGRVEEVLKQMSERIEALERDNTALRHQVNDLRDQTDQPWLDEERARQIRALVEDVLMDADTRASLQSSGMTAGWDDGFFLSSPDGRFLLRLDGQMQFRYVLSWVSKSAPNDPVDQYRGGFENTRTHLTFRGHVFDRSLSYLLRLAASRGGGGSVNEFDEANGGQVQLLDAWMRWRFSDQWSIRAGQFKLPFSREELVGSAYQLAVERSLVNESMGIGRSQGIELGYTGDFLDWRLAFSDGGTDTLLGVGALTGTSPPNTPWSQQDTEYAFTSRLEWLIAGDWGQFKQMTSPPGNPFGVLFGIAGHYQQGEYGPAPREANWLNTTADLSLDFSGATLYFAALYSYLDTPNFGEWNILGGMVQGSVYIAPKWELFLQFQYGYIDSNSDVVNAPDLSVLTAGVNWYIDGQDLKFSVDVGVALDDVSQFWAFDIAGYRSSLDGSGGQIVVRTQFQLLF